MSGYTPLYISGNETGLVQSRVEHILPNDAYPVLENAFVWRERIKRKQGYQTLGRFQRNFDDVTTGLLVNGISTSILKVSGYVSNITNALNAVVTSTAPHGLMTGDVVAFSGVNGMTQINNLVPAITVIDAITFSCNGVDSTAFGVYTSGGFWYSTRLLLATQPNATVVPGSAIFTVHAGPDIVLTDQGDGTFTSPTPGNSGTINYATGFIVLNTTAPNFTIVSLTYSYYPGLPVMGLRLREQNSVNNEQTVGFDTKYAYKFQSGAWQEFIPGTVWSGNDSDFFWTTNYWVGDANLKIFWETNFDGTGGEPIRYTNGIAWANFAPTVNAAGVKLQQCQAILPFRGRLLVFNTLEGLTLNASTAFPQRIRWSSIGTPFSDVSSIVSIGGINPNAWRDDIRGQGGFLNIPTSESIISVGFVRDNIVIYCERSTWQLRYTGRSIAPFQLEKVNTELGAEGTFSAVQFDTSLIGIGDKGIVECDSFSSHRIDIKIPDLIFDFDNEDNGPQRVYGVRDFQQRLAFWVYPFRGVQQEGDKFPNRRLVYNYENDSWAIFTDSLTALGTFQSQAGRTWQNTKIPWEDCNFPWINRPSLFPSIVGGNQQGYVLYLDTQVTNDPSLFIINITGNTTTPTVITSPFHNLETGQIIKIVGIIAGSPFATSLNGNIFGVVRVDKDNFQLWKYSTGTLDFTIPQLDAPATYIGGGEIRIRDGFTIQSKKFNFLEDGQNIQLGFIDILLANTEDGAIALNVLLDYNDASPINILPENQNVTTNQPDSFFNSVVETFRTGGISTTKNFKRVFCPVRGAFITVIWTLSNAQLVGPEQESQVEIEAQILWIRKAGRQLPAGV